MSGSFVEERCPRIVIQVGEIDELDARGIK